MLNGRARRAYQGLSLRPGSRRSSPLDFRCRLIGRRSKPVVTGTSRRSPGREPSERDRARPDQPPTRSRHVAVVAASGAAQEALRRRCRLATLTIVAFDDETGRAALDIARRIAIVDEIEAEDIHRHADGAHRDGQGPAPRLTSDVRPKNATATTATRRTSEQQKSERAVAPISCADLAWRHSPRLHRVIPRTEQDPSDSPIETGALRRRFTVNMNPIR